MKKMIPKKTIQRGVAFRARMLQDLAAKGLGDDDIQDVALEKDVDASDPRVITAWKYIVTIKGGELVYTHSNEPSAPVLCNGTPINEMGEA